MKTIIKRNVSLMLCLVILLHIFPAVGATAAHGAQPRAKDTRPLHIMYVIDLSMNSLYSSTLGKEIMLKVADEVFSWNSENKMGIATARMASRTELACGLTNRKGTFTSAVDTLFSDTYSGDREVSAGLELARAELAAQASSNVRSVVIYTGNGLPRSKTDTSDSAIAKAKQIHSVADMYTGFINYEGRNEGPIQYQKAEKIAFFNAMSNAGYFYAEDAASVAALTSDLIAALDNSGAETMAIENSLNIYTMVPVNETSYDYMLVMQNSRDIVQNAQWRVSDTSIAKLETADADSVKITGLKPGYVTLYAKANGVEVSLDIMIFDVYIDYPPNPAEFEVGALFEPKAIRLPDNMDCSAQVSWGLDHHSSIVRASGSAEYYGKYNAIAPGITKMSAKYSSLLSGGSFASDEITITVKAKQQQEKNLVVNPASMTIPEGDSKTFTLTLMPDNTNVLSKATYKIQDPTIITRSGNKITAKKVGATKIDITYGTLTASINVEVTAKGSVSEDSKPYLAITPPSTSVAVKDSIKLNAYLMPENLSVSSSATWSSSDTKIATVSTLGRVYGVSAGSVIITAKYNGMTATADVLVTSATDIKPTAIQVQPTGMRGFVGDVVTLTVTVVPANAKTIFTWKSSDGAIAAVDKNGILTCKKAGTATITCTTSNGITGSIKITIEKRKNTYRALILGYDTFSDMKEKPAATIGTALNVKHMENYLKKHTQYTAPIVKKNRTLSQTKNDIKLAFKGAGSNDVSLLYISGLGYSNKAGNITFKTSDGQYWSIKSLRSWLENIPGQVVVILDMSYAGAFITKSVHDAVSDADIAAEIATALLEEEEGAQQKALNNAKFHVLTSCGQNDTNKVSNYSSMGGYMSVFTNALCNAFTTTGADSNKDKKITLRELETYTLKGVSAYGMTATAYPKYCDDIIFSIK